MKSYAAPLTSQEIEWKKKNRLEKAAPDLLSALEELLADQETMKEPYRNEAICERARAAIAKAKGGVA